MRRKITDKTGYKRVNSFYTNGEVKVDRPEDADTIEYFFFVERWGYIVLMVKDEPTALTPEEEAKEREEQLKQERKDAAVKALSEATARAYELRADFVATVSAAAIKKRLADIVALWAYAEYWDDTGWLTEEEISQATGVEPPAEEDGDSGDDAEFTLQAVTDALGKTPEKALLRMIYARLGDGKSEGYFRSYWNSYTMKHEENEKLDRIYALLVKLGYEMSDDEKGSPGRNTRAFRGGDRRMRASTCKGCGAAIVWIKTPGGKSMPCDATPRYYIEKPRSGSKRSSRLTARSFPASIRKIRTRPPAPASLPTGGAAGRQAASSRGRNAMDKLTWYDEDGRLYCRRGYEVALARLASYEATELMPDEIVKMGMMFEDSKRYSGRLELKLNAAAKRMPKWVSVKREVTGRS